MMTPAALRKLGVLGMNARIGRYMNRQNKRRDYPRVDDKVQTARLCDEHDIPTPKNYGIITAFGQLRDLNDLLRTLPAFVVKPARGSMGNGILVIREVRPDGTFLKSSGNSINYQDLRYHIQNILSGLYSLSGHFDHAVLQYCMTVHPALESISYQGVPDVRIIVYRGFPVMAMSRLPTSGSDGRANLHQGAVGLGIDLLTGKGTTAVLHNRLVDFHPDTGVKLWGHSIPFWDKILQIAIGCYEVSRLGYLGVDIALDKDLGPMVLEMNARPGLSIQVANQLGLRPRLENVDRFYQERGELVSAPPEREQSWPAVVLGQPR